MESRRAPGPATLRYHDAVLGCLREAGFSLALAAHAFAVLDAYIFGFALQASSLPGNDAEEFSEAAADVHAALPDGAYPHLAELAERHVLQPGYDFDAEFGWGLELVLDGLERAFKREQKGA